MRGQAQRGVVWARRAGCAALSWLALWPAAAAAGPPRPNILWLTSEDHGPHMGCYGDAYASTPHVDALATRGVVYAFCWSNAPVCAPARTTLISGLYANSTGAEHMRSMVRLPAGKQLLPQLLRAGGYYCVNNEKEDYNVAVAGPAWDESGPQAHWSKRPAGQPFFAVFNSSKSHESQIRKRPHAALHDPAGVRVPAYHPDTPEVRQDWAQYYDMVSEADADAGRRLKELEDAGLAGDTIVFYFADHGSGMPRNKRWPYDSGLRVPLVVHVPDKFAAWRTADYVAGGKSDRLVGFIDFAPTVLSLAGVEPPAWMQGRAFLGPFAAEPGPYVFGFRGRMDERIDMVRTASDGRYVYVRNYMPHRIYGQHLVYMWQTPTTVAWERLHAAGQLNAAQQAFWNTKPAEELYDLANDRDEVRNLAGAPEHRAALERLRAAQQALAVAIRDVGFLPEGEVYARSADIAPYDMARDEARYPLEQILEAAEQAAGPDPAAVPRLIRSFEHPDPAVRYWAATGLLIRGRAAVAQGRGSLVSALADPSPFVRIVAAEALARHGGADDRPLAVKVLADHADASVQSVFVALAALNALDQVPGAEEVKSRLRQFSPTAVPHRRYRTYVPRLRTNAAAVE